MAEVYSDYCNRVFEIFVELSKIPHGSGNMNKISQYCIDFVSNLGLDYVCDCAKNIIVYKDGSKGFENSEPIALQGHLDMVCQKSADCNIDFLNDGISIYRDGDFLRANGTTLGADNGIAVAMALSILERDDIPHPPIEVVFTTDEEIGMIGAAQLDTSLLKSKKLINIDSEEDDTVTVSCAGGSDFKAELSIKRIIKKSSGVRLVLKGLKGGHSGVEINSHRINAAVLAGRILQHLKSQMDFSIISVNSGDKSNAIPNYCVIELACENANDLCGLIDEYISVIRKEISYKESGFETEISVLDNDNYFVLDNIWADKLIYSLCLVPNGIIEMSAEIEGLVETSLNLGILATNENDILFQFALRSNKLTALKYLEQRLSLFFYGLGAKVSVGGHYPPWEYKKDSNLKEVYIDAYSEIFGVAPKVEAIHAGLECAIFSSSISDADCIAIGPTICGAHTVDECLSISSTEKIYRVLLRVLEKL